MNTVAVKKKGFLTSVDPAGGMWEYSPLQSV